jgi:hypothetical protein
VFSGFTGTDVEPMPLDEVPPPSKSAKAFSVSNPDPIAQARFSVALEEFAEVGVPVANTAIAERVDRLIALADEFGVPVVSPRPRAERAGMAVLRPEDGALTVLTASLHNHGLTVTVRGGDVRLCAHVSTSDETFDLLRAALVEYSTAAPV